MTREEEIEQLHRAISEKDHQIAYLQNEVRELDRQLKLITGSNGWKWLQRAWKLKTALSGGQASQPEMPAASVQPVANQIIPADDLPLRKITSLNQLSDDEWLKVLIGSIKDSRFQDFELPGFPPAEIQESFVGESAETALRSIYPFYRMIKKYAETFGHRLTPESSVLDFGCGWGRISRFFMHDLKAENIYGVDVLESAVDICRQSKIPGQFSVIPNRPPLDFPDNSFDAIYAFSVFSHLPEELARQWVLEFSRLLRPGGLMVVTTQGRRFIEYCASFRGKENTFVWHQLLANSFVDTEKNLAAYDRGDFLYEANGGGDNPALAGSVYGDALIPRGYVEREWTKYLSFRDFIDDPSVLPQALIVMQKDGSKNG